MSHLYLFGNLMVIVTTLLIGVPLTSMAANNNSGSNVEFSANPSDNFELPLVNGEILKVDPASSKITIKHDQIPNIGLPAMTMSFNVSDVEMLNQFKAGDTVKFAISKLDGALTIMSLEMVS